LVFVTSKTFFKSVYLISVYFGYEILACNYGVTNKKIKLSFFFSLSLLLIAPSFKAQKPYKKFCLASSSPLPLAYLNVISLFLSSQKRTQFFSGFLLLKLFFFVDLRFCFFLKNTEGEGGGISRIPEAQKKT